MFERTRYLDWAARNHGKARFDLAASGIPTAPTDPLAFACVDDVSAWPRLRDAIARHGDVTQREAIAALGTTHALWLAYASVTEPGDDVLVEDPAYEPLVRIAEGVGARVVRFARPRQQRFALDPDRVEHSMTPRTKVIAVTNLHNPSGVRADDGALAAIARMAESRGAVLLVDEVYAPFDGLTDPGGVFRGSARKLAPNVLAACSLTKCYGLGPQRIGWLTGPPEIIARAEAAVTATCGALPLAHAHAALAAFENMGPLADRARAILAGKRDVVGAWVKARGFEWSAPDSGLFGFVDGPAGVDLTSAIEATARDRDVLVTPGSFFGIADGFRVAWSAPFPILEEGLQRLAEGLRASFEAG